jgi:hypothetical protein
LGIYEFRFSAVELGLEFLDGEYAHVLIDYIANICVIVHMGFYYLLLGFLTVYFLLD